MPWLDLLSEEDLDFSGVFLLNQRKDGIVERIEHFVGVRANIVEVEL